MQLRVTSGDPARFRARSLPHTRKRIVTDSLTDIHQTRLHPPLTKQIVGRFIGSFDAIGGIFGCWNVGVTNEK